MAITDFPWFKIYAAETLSDENFLSWGLAERGVWITLLCHCWKEGSIPSDISKLARICSCNADAMQEHWTGIADRFRESQIPGRLICPRLEFERELSIQESEDKSQHGKKAAHARWNKYKTEMPEHCPSIARGMPSDAPQPQPQPQPMKDINPAPSPSALLPEPSSSGKPKKEKKPKIITTALRPEALEAFQAIWEAFPRRGPQKWDREAQSYVSEPQSPGSRLKAETNFQRIIDNGVASARLLYLAFYAYVTEEPKVEKGFVQQVSTFFGPEKATYLEWLDRARQIERENYQEAQ